MHLKIEQSLYEIWKQSVSLVMKLNIPHHQRLVHSEESEWWQSRVSRFPTGYEHCNTLVTERILPFGQDTREKVIDLFCLPRSREIIKQSRKDHDCLLRPYLGRRRTNFSCPSQFFTLRNKPLLVNQLEGLGLPVEQYAQTMADALSIIYWLAKTDGNDIEFVLAPPREEEDGFSSNVLGTHRLWVLDFDCVNPMTLDKAGVEQAARAFMKNDHFFPQPDMEHDSDRRLWKIFSSRFLESSKCIIGESKLPKYFLDCLERLGSERQSRKTMIGAATD